MTAKQTYTVREAANVLNCSKQYVHELIRARRLAAKKRDGHWLVDQESVLTLKAGRSSGTSVLVPAIPVVPAVRRSLKSVKQNVKRSVKPRRARLPGSKGQLLPGDSARAVKQSVKSKGLTGRTWKCAGCGASGAVTKSGYLAAHFLASPGCRRVEISLHGEGSDGGAGKV